MDLLSLKKNTIHDNYKRKSDSTTASKKGWIYYQYLLWMNEWCIYIALYCVLLYTQSDLQLCVCVCVCGGGGVIVRQPQYNGASALISYKPIL